MIPQTADKRLTHLYEQHYHEVLAYCARRIGLLEAEDVVAGVFVVAWRRVEEIEFSTARAWLYAIARRMLANRHRSVRRRQRLTTRVSGLAHSPPHGPTIKS